MRSGMLTAALQFLAPLVVGLVVPSVMRALKRWVPAAGEAGTETQRVVVALLGALGNALATLTGVALGADPALWTDVEIRSVLSASIAYAVHASGRARAAAVVAEEAAAVRAAVTRAGTAALAREMAAAGEHPMRIDGPDATGRAP